MMKIIQYVVIVGWLITASSAIAEDGDDEVIRSLFTEKRITLECKLPQYYKDNYMRSETYKSCFSEKVADTKSKFPDAKNIPLGLIKVGCLLSYTLTREFTKSFVVDKDVSTISLRKDGSRQGSDYNWSYQYLFYTDYLSKGTAEFSVDRSDLSYNTTYKLKNDGDMDFGSGQCTLLEGKERKF